MIGSTIAHYRILAEIGHGGMGIVYKALDTRLERTVALKFLPTAEITARDRQRFLQEARSAAQVHHPNICPIHAIEEVDGRLFFTMAFVEGRTLTKLLEHGPLRAEQATAIALQIAAGLDAAHRRGIIHRDIKSSNVMVTSDGHACILDFGLALCPGADRLTRAGRAVGTPAYMSPEQAQSLDVDQRSDIWSLGVVLYEMVTGRLPFRGAESFSVLHKILHEPPQPVATVNAPVPAPLERIIMKALEKHPEDRQQSAAEFAAELRRTVPSSSPDEPTLTMLDSTPLSREQPVKKRWRLAAAVLAVIVLLAVAGLAAWRLQNRVPSQQQVAVLPLELIGSDDATRTLADGLVETITSKLTLVEEFEGKVSVVPSSEIRKRKITSVEDARRAFGVNLAITGSAQRWGDRVLFTLNLVDAQRLVQLGARTLEFTDRQPLAFRDDAVTAVYRLLRRELTPAARGVATAGETATPAAYSDYLKGRGYLARYDVKGNIDRAVDAFQSAVEKDPKYALAYAGLAEAYHWRFLGSDDPKVADKALAAAEQAVALDPNLAVARVKLGELYAARGKKEDAIKELDRALQLAPGNSDAYRALGEAYGGLGRYKEAEGAYREAIRRRPTDWNAHFLLGWFYAQRTRYQEAEVEYFAAKKLSPDNEIIYRNLAVIYMRQGRYRDAIAQLQQSLKLQPFPRTYSSLGVAYYYLGDYRQASAALETAIDLDSRVYSFWGNLGAVYRHAETDQTKAESALRRAVELAETVLGTNPDDNNLRANLAEYHAKLGNRQAALAQVERIPAASRPQYAGRIMLAYELTGNRAKAIELLRAVPATTPLHDIKNDPDLTKLWNDGAFQAALRSRP
jgi:serine/threonine-protein kinase